MTRMQDDLCPGCGEPLSPMGWEETCGACGNDDVADFFEPVTYDWDEDVFQAREAARKYSEQTTTDY